MSYETYFGRYKELNETYKIARGRYCLLTKEEREGLSLLEVREAEDKAMDQYDVVIEPAGSGYAHTKYRVLRNKPGLSMRDLAIICDKGNLCFGYRVDNGIICVHTD